MRSEVCTIVARTPGGKVHRAVSRLTGSGTVEVLAQVLVLRSRTIYAAVSHLTPSGLTWILPWVFGDSVGSGVDAVCISSQATMSPCVPHPD